MANKMGQNQNTRTDHGLKWFESVIRIEKIGKKNIEEDHKKHVKLYFSGIIIEFFISENINIPQKFYSFIRGSKKQNGLTPKR